MKSIAWLDKKTWTRQAPSQRHKSYFPSQSIDVHPWWQGKGFRTHCLSAGIAAWQVLLQPAGEAAWCAAGLQGARMGVGAQPAGWHLIGSVALHKPLGLSGLKEP